MTPYIFLMSQLLSFPLQPDIKLDVTKSEEVRPWAFIAPHENEHVGNAYLKQQVEKFGGIFAVLKQHGQRHVSLVIDKHSLEIDPNRIFTELGRFSTLSKLNPQLADQPLLLAKAEKRAEALADFMLEAIHANEASSWVAIHNNTHGYDDDGHGGRGTISIKRYQKKLEGGANYLIRVHDAGKDEDDLFFITEGADYKVMKEASFNVVLQNPDVGQDPSEDDGSLSVLAEKQGRRYVNVEAERQSEDGFGEDHLEEQQAMIDLLFTILKNERP